MADLAKTQTPVTARRRGSDNRDYTLPARRATDAPNLEINAPLVGPNQSKAQALMQLLGVAQDAGDAVVGELAYRQGEKNRALTQEGRLAGEAGTPDQSKMGSKYYAEAYYTVGAERAGLEFKASITQKVNERLADEDNPATLEEINKLFDDEAGRIALNEDGTPRDLGGPKAQLALANALGDARAAIIGPAAEIIRKQTNAKLVNNLAFVAVTKGLPELPGSAPGVPGIEAVSVPPSAVAADPQSKPDVAAAPTRATTAKPVADGGKIMRGLFPNARITSTTRSANSALGRANPNSWHVKSNAAVDMAPIPGMTFEQAKAQIEASGYSLLEAIDEVKHPSKHATGPHWHFVLAEGAQASGAQTDPNLKPDRTAGTPPQYTKRYDFESLMAQVPPSVPRGEAKAALIDALILNADEQGKADILYGIVHSTRADGTPSFTVDEMTKLHEAGRAIESRARVEADRVRKERYDANADKLMGEIIDGRTVTRETIREWVKNDDIDENFAFSLINHLDAEERQAEAEQRAESRQAAAEANADYDADAYSLIAEREAGDLRGASEAEDRARLDRGEFGTGKKAIARYRQARAAARRGASVIIQSPEAQSYAGALSDEYKVVSKGNGSMLSGLGGSADQATRNGVMAAFKDNIASGMSPARAYQEAKRAWPVNPKDREAALRARQAELLKNN